MNTYIPPLTPQVLPRPPPARSVELSLAVLPRDAAKHSQRDGDQPPDHEDDHDGAERQSSRGLGGWGGG